MPHLCSLFLIHLLILNRIDVKEHVYWTSEALSSGVRDSPPSLLDLLHMISI
jgi:hypothetical protein